MISLRRTTAKRRAVAGVLAASFLAAALPVVSPTASAVATVELDLTTFNGANRYDTAALIATYTYGDDAPLDNIIIARGDAFPDALAGNALAGAAGAPILLTRPGSLPSETADAIEELAGEDTVLHFLGGTDAISDAVVDAALALIPVPDEDENGMETSTAVFWRIDGATRYDTAINIATFMSDNLTIGTTFTGERSVFVTVGNNFADAVAVGPLAYDGKSPVLLVPSLPEDSTIEDAEANPYVDKMLDALIDLDIDSVIILGGPAAVAPSVEAAIAQRLGPDKIDRIGGANRFQTAALIADYARDQLAFNIQNVLIARGENNPQAFADALAGGTFGGEVKAPIVLVRPDSLPIDTAAWLDDNDNVIRKLWRLGGPAAVSDEVMRQARNAAQTAAIYELGDRTDAPELQFVRAVAGAGNDNVLEFVFDQVVDGSALEFNEVNGTREYFNLRAYRTNCGVTTAASTDRFIASEAAILGNGNVIRARFPVAASQIQRVGIVWDTVINQTGISNIEAGYPVTPRECVGLAGTPGFSQSNLIYTTNWRLAPEITAQQSITVDFVFNNPNVGNPLTPGASHWPGWLLGAEPGTFNNLPGFPQYWENVDPAFQFFLVGNQSLEMQGLAIVIDGTGPVADGYQVRVLFEFEEQQLVNAGALRRGYVRYADDVDEFVQQITTGPVWQYTLGPDRLCRTTANGVPLFVAADLGGAPVLDGDGNPQLGPSATAPLPAGADVWIPWVVTDDSADPATNCLKANISDPIFLGVDAAAAADGITLGVVPFVQAFQFGQTPPDGLPGNAFPLTFLPTTGAIPFLIPNPAFGIADGLIQSGGYVQSSMITVDPDLMTIVRQPNLGNQAVFDFTFDEAVSRFDVNLDPSAFGIYNREFTTILLADQVFWVADANSRTIRAYYPAPAVAAIEVAGGYVEDSAVRGTDTQQGLNDGFNRPAGVLLSFDTGGVAPGDGFTLEAGYTTLPDLSTVTRTQNTINQNFRVTYTFDARYGGNICAVTEPVWFTVYDPQGTYTAALVIPSTLPAAISTGSASCAGNAVTFDGGLGSDVNGLLNNDAIENAVVGGVHNIIDEQGIISPSVVTEGSAIVNGDARFPAGAELVPAGMS